MSADEYSRSSRSQLSARVPSLTTTSGSPCPGESVAKSSSQHRPASTQSAPQTQQIASGPTTDQLSASQPLPPSGKQRLICSVEVPGVGRAAKVDYFQCNTCNALAYT